MTDSDSIRVPNIIRSAHRLPTSRCMPHRIEWCAERVSFASGCSCVLSADWSPVLR